MSQPFDFTNTPITENTILVARYKSANENESVYGGDWCRMTTNNNHKLVFQTESQAGQALTAGAASDSIIGIDEATGNSYTTLAQNIISVEFGGGWTTKITTGSVHGAVLPFLVYTTLGRITGYPQGMDCTYFGQYSNLHSVDITGFKFDEILYNAIIATNGLFNPVFSSNTANPGTYGIIEPMFSPSLISPNNTIFSARGNYATASLTWTKGFGFVGQYAKEWLEAFPPVPITGSSSNTVCRNTYLG